MSILFHTAALSAALLAALAVPASSQDPNPPPAGDQPAAPEQPFPEPAPKSDKPDPQTPAPPMEPSLTLASKLIGTEIVDSAEKKLGKVKDLVVEPEGTVIVIADRKDGGLVAVPLDLLPPRIEAKDAAQAIKKSEPLPIEKLELRADPQLLATATVLSKDAVKTLDATALERARRHFAGKDPLPPEKQPAEQPAADAARPLCVEEARGKDVKAPSGEELGELKDVVIDVTGAKAAYVVVASGGVMGVGETAHGVPLKGLSRSANGDFLLNTDQKTLDNSPGIDLERLPSRPSLQISAKASLTDGSYAHRTQR